MSGYAPLTRLTWLSVITSNQSRRRNRRDYACDSDMIPTV